MKWIGRKKVEHRKKYLLASDMLQWALEQGFPRCTVLFGNDLYGKKYGQKNVDFGIRL